MADPREELMRQYEDTAFPGTFFRRPGGIQFIEGADLRFVTLPGNHEAEDMFVTPAEEVHIPEGSDGNSVYLLASHTDIHVEIGGDGNRVEFAEPLVILGSPASRHNLVEVTGDDNLTVGSDAVDTFRVSGKGNVLEQVGPEDAIHLYTHRHEQPDQEAFLPGARNTNIQYIAGSVERIDLETHGDEVIFRKGMHGALMLETADGESIANLPSTGEIVFDYRNSVQIADIVEALQQGTEIAMHIDRATAELVAPLDIRVTREAIRNAAL